MNAATNMSAESLNLNEKRVLSILIAAPISMKLDIIIDWLTYCKDADEAAINATLVRIIKDNSSDRYLAVISKVIMKDSTMRELFMVRHQECLFAQSIDNEPALTICSPETIQYVDRSIDAASFQGEPTPSDQRDAREFANAAADDNWDVA
jgi:hypothetical protein